MNFRHALNLMKDGYKVKLPSWGGYWCWDDDKKTIMMHCKPSLANKTGEVLDIRDTERVEYTIENILSEEWIIATEKNTPILGGTLGMSFSDALKYMKRGLRVRRKCWKEGYYMNIVEVKSYLCDVCVPIIYTNMPYLEGEDGKWKANQDDIVACDWEFYNE